jgi:hypothetical protein
MDFFGLIVTLVIIAIVLGIAWWIVIQIPLFAGGANWILRVAFGLICLLIVIALVAGKIPVIKFG